MGVPSFHNTIPFTILDRIIRLPGIIGTKDVSNLSQLPTNRGFALVRDDDEDNDTTRAFHKSLLLEDLKAAHAAETSDDRQAICESWDDGERKHISFLDRNIEEVLARALEANKKLQNKASEEVIRSNQSILEYAIEQWKILTTPITQATPTKA